MTGLTGLHGYGLPYHNYITDHVFKANEPNVNMWACQVCDQFDEIRIFRYKDMKMSSNY